MILGLIAIGGLAACWAVEALVMAKRYRRDVARK